MKRFEFEVELDMITLRESYERNHFDGAIDFWEYQKTYDELMPTVHPIGLMKEMTFEEISALTRVSCEHDGDFVIGVISLGAGVDQYEMEQNAAEDYSEVYRMDCISLDILSASYESFCQMVWKETGKHICEFQFLGEDLPVELMKDFLECVESEKSHISCNEAGMLTPKKTVVFLSELMPEGKEEITKGSEGSRHGVLSVCEHCSNLTCSNRKHG